MRFSIILSYIGLACSCILVVSLIIFAIIDIKSVNRVTIRLVTGIAIADILTHTSAVLTIGSFKYIGTPYCTTLAAITTLDRHLYSFTNIAISYHLYRAIVQLKKPSFKVELVVWIVMVTIISLIMVVYNYLGVFSGTMNKKACNPGADNVVITKVVTGLIGFFDFLAILSGIIVTIIAHKYIEKWILAYSDSKFRSSEDQIEFKAAKLKATKRSFLYPLSAVLTLSTEVILCFWMVVDNPPYILFSINSTMMGFKGILTLITFCMDQAVWKSFKVTYEKLSDIQLNKL
jgi:hypothetical protein